MDIKVARFQADYAKIKAHVKQLKQKLREIKKMVKPISKAAYRLYEHGDKTMYNEKNGRIIEPKFKTLPNIMGDLEFWMALDGDVQHMIENIL